MRRAQLLAAVLSFPVLPFPNAAALPGGGGRVTEVVRLQASDGHALEGTFFKAGDARAPALILVHDAGGNREQLEPLADRLCKQGFGVLTLDLRGHGASKSEGLDWGKLSENEKKSTWAAAPQDIDAAATWLAKQPSILDINLSLVGVGSGCALLVRHAKNDENVVCMALLAPHPTDYGFDVRAEIETLEGLPTFVFTSKNEEAERMAMQVNASSSSPYLELSLSVSPKLGTPLEDKNLPGKLSKWLVEKAMPKRGQESRR